jgi:hypothetical protein
MIHSRQTRGDSKMSRRFFWFCLLFGSVTCSLPPASRNVLTNIRSFAADYREYYTSGTMNSRFQQTVELLRLRTPWKGANPKFDPLLFDIISPEEKEPVIVWQQIGAL